MDSVRFRPRFVFSGDTAAVAHEFEIELYEREFDRLELDASWSEEQRKAHAKYYAAIELLRVRGPRG